MARGPGARLRLFDASALVNLMVTRGGSALEVAKGNDVLDLTLYEGGNALWKLSTLLGKISTEDADSLLRVMARTAVHHMNLIRVSELDHLSIAGMARAERVTYYDAAYVTAARERDRELVTDDARLASVASKFLRVVSSTELTKRPFGGL